MIRFAGGDFDGLSRALAARTGAPRSAPSASGGDAVAGSSTASPPERPASCTGLGGLVLVTNEAT